MSTQNKLTVNDLKFTADRQRELMRVLLDRFSRFQKRGQHHYLLNGMSTSHLTLKCIEDHQTLFSYWPANLTKYDPKHGNIYAISDDAMTQVQSEIRKDIEKLSKKGYIVRVGNDDERRWIPVKSLIGLTL